MKKSVFTSKTLWVNLLGIIAIVAQGQFGYAIDPEKQVAALGVINFILRLITKEPVSW